VDCLGTEWWSLCRLGAPVLPLPAVCVRADSARPAPEVVRLCRSLCTAGGSAEAAVRRAQSPRSSFEPHSIGSGTRAVAAPDCGGNWPTGSPKACAHCPWFGPRCCSDAGSCAFGDSTAAAVPLVGNTGRGEEPAARSASAGVFCGAASRLSFGTAARGLPPPAAVASSPSTGDGSRSATTSISSCCTTFCPPAGAGLLAAARRFFSSRR